MDSCHIQKLKASRIKTHKSFQGSGFHKDFLDRTLTTKAKWIVKKLCRKVENISK